VKRGYLFLLVIPTIVAGVFFYRTATTAPLPVSSTAPAFTRPAAIPGVENFAQVGPFLYRGAQPTAAGFVELKKRGIKTVINLRWLHSDRDELAGSGLQYLEVSCKAWHPEDEDVLKVLKALRDPANYPVFIHCQHGADRTGTMIAAFRMVEQDWRLEDAVAELNAFGFHPVWTEINAYLKKFSAEQIRRQIDSTPAPKMEVVK
jgi:tyrosine-protein phosphatase SIW14